MKHQLKAMQVGANSAVVKRSDELNAYLAMIKNFKPLTSDEEVMYGERIQRSPKDSNGKPTDRRSIDALVNANLGFVVSVAKKYEYCGGCLSLMDLINEGNIGLIDAAETFDPTMGFKFISYAVNYIRMRILDALTKKSRLVANYNTGAPNSHTSLDAPVADDNDTILADVLCTSTDAESFASESLVSDIMRILNNLLNPTEVTIICILYGINTRKQEKWELADALGKTRERIRQVEQNALDKLRNSQQALTLLSKYRG